MSRWQPDARGRLGQAAIDLYFERGFEQTSVADIAAAAGLTARTFFRYFPDKREVLFSGSDALAERLAATLRDLAARMSPLDAVAAALHEVSTWLGNDHDHSHRRKAVIDANPGLAERERSKMAAWATGLADGLRGAGADPAAAAVAAETGVAVFRLAFDRWAGDPAPDVALTDVLDDYVAQLRAVATA